MSSCCQGLQSQFDRRQAARDLRRYRRRGPSRTSRMLVRAADELGVEGYTMIDIGGGVGALQHELLRLGVRQTVDVDVSTAYIDAAKEEGVRRGHRHRMEFVEGDFVEVADGLDPADIVTLDRVICCYPEMEKLVIESARHARRALGLVFPRSGRVPAAVTSVANLLLALRRSGFRVYNHETAEVDRLIRDEGFELKFAGSTLAWQVFLYCRDPASIAALERQPGASAGSE